MTAATIAELNRRFAIPGIARVAEGNGGLAKVVVTTGKAAGEIYLHGAHVTSWRPSGKEEVLFVSSKSRWEPGRAIRGGIPICFPWFADKANDPTAPAHGFARTALWQLESITQTDDAATVDMRIETSADTKKWWPADFQAVYRATFGSQLHLELTVTNSGTSPLVFEEALHTYFRVGQIEQVRLQGLDAVQYLDKTDSKRKKIQQGPIVIESETDRVYLNHTSSVELEDHWLHRRNHINKQNSLTTVVWNPWIDKAKAMSDFGVDEWRQMVCVEVSNVADFAVELAPSQQHAMRTVYRVADL
jgi:glucose-6-phosphate 1-epimerase